MLQTFAQFIIFYNELHITMYLQDQHPGTEYYYMTTDKNEKYRCSIPDVTELEEDPKDNYTGLNPMEILSPLFKQKICSYRVSFDM